VPSDPERRQSAGFALIIVLWTLVLIAFIVAHLTGSGRVEIRIANNLVANAVAAAAADGAVSRTIFNLTDPNPESRWPLDGTAHAFKIGDCRLVVRVHDEVGEINPNLASPALLETLLRVTGSDPDSARRLARAIGEWVGAPGAARPQAALVEEYRGAGLDYAPPGEPLETLSELRRVLGITPQVFAAIRPHLSLFAPAEPSSVDADPVVKAVMAALGQANPPGNAAGRQGAIFIARIAVVSHGPDNARAARTVVVRVAPPSGSYTILAWNDDTG